MVTAVAEKAPVRRAYPRRGHNTAGRYYRSLMYIGLRTSDALHKKICGIGPGLGELRRIPLPRTLVNKVFTPFAIANRCRQLRRW
jgi:hypothetical protein